jgi:hypothetical protein
MPALRRAAAIWPAIATLRSSISPIVEQYLYVIGIPGLFKFYPDSIADDDGWTVIAPTGNGRYRRVAFPDRGDDLDDTTPQTIDVTGGPWRVIPAATLAANTTLNLDDAGAVEGDTLEITRLDVGAYTVAIVNGGPGAGTLCTMPVSARAWAMLYFNGTNWTHRRSCLML